jgi:hypothetical protein
MKESYEWYQTWNKCRICKCGISPRHRIDGVAINLCVSCFKLRARQYELDWQDQDIIDQRIKELGYV